VRLLIVAGGTGGHIYPALAVARSLAARPDSPELRWVGGHRGLESTVIPPTGIPFRRLLVRSLRSVGFDQHVVLDRVLHDRIVAEQGEPGVTVTRLHRSHGPLPELPGGRRHRPDVGGRHRSTWAITVSAKRRAR